MKEYKISAISEGTVIDHITPAATFKVIEILNLDKRPDLIISVGNNMSSNHLGKKGIIKISGSFLGADDANKIALIAPNATLNIIKNFKVTEKKQLKIPDKIEGIVKCFNPNCITNIEGINPRFTVTSRNPIKLLCIYCERSMKQEDFVLL